ncbi:TrbC/VirB2 family protein [Pseudomonas sp. DCB_CB]|uniref:TrbC/VirB2 family protein n=1 Tax=unclassified Pseudomonas TaxID=196821 RepID=UPI0022497E2B|nr:MULTISPECIES: TrbC/VirB2 family protein [unclassified Pseudomonas]MCX2694519.1 TrbC/VirB2 family protein [Pseudomonas sp. DCB_BZ]MCX2859651.1 TrbC/VirB2 family protein [Pseudomonas sp. DCB_CB]
MNLVTQARKAMGSVTAKAWGNAELLMLCAFMAFMPEVAMAAPWDDAGDKALAILNGGLARTLAIIAVTALGVSALKGKIAWEWAGAIIVGIVLIFGGAYTVTYFAG